MEAIKRHIKFFFQTERIHPLHVFAVSCFFVSIVTLSFEIIVAMTQRNVANLLLKSTLLICFIMVFIGSRRAYLKYQKMEWQVAEDEELNE